MARGYPDFTGPKVGVYLQPEWAAKEGKDKSFRGWGNDIVSDDSAVVQYTVPVGKTLYITQVSFSMWGSAVANKDLNQIGNMRLKDITTGDEFIELGGNGGNSQNFTKPIVFAAGHQMDCRLFNEANHACHLRVTAQGYEV